MNVAQYITLWTDVVTEIAREIALDHDLDPYDDEVIKKMRNVVLRTKHLHDRALSNMPPAP